MPIWLVEDPTPVYLLLGLAILGLGVGFWVLQDRKLLIGLGIASALILLIALLDFLVVTDHERLMKHVQTMAGGVADKNVDRIFKHISESFRFGPIDKAAFRGWVEMCILNGDVTELRVWEFERGKAPGDKSLHITFLVKGRGNAIQGPEFYRCDATFVLDPDGEWRMSGFELFDPQKDPAKAEPLPLPVQ